MAGGLSMREFLDWALNTGPIFLSGTDNIVNNVSRRSFVLGKFLRGKPGSQVLQGGNKIQETLYLAPKRNFQTFKRNQDLTWQNPQKDELVQYDWRFTLGHMTWDEAEYLLQTSGSSGSALATKYKDMRYSKEQRLWEDIIDGWETLLWANPAGAATYAEMEGQNGQEPYSIPAFVHQNAAAGQGFDSNWTTVGQVPLATYPNWDNKRETYSLTGTVSDNLFAAFDRMSLEIEYEQPGMKDQYFESEDQLGNPTIICASKLGVTQVMKFHRASNDMLIQPQDAAYPMPRWNGIALKDVSALDTAPLYGGQPEATASPAGARYYFLNCNYLKMIFHSAKYFQMASSPKEPENKVGVFVVPVECWGNMVCTSRRHQGIVYPAT